MRCLILRFTPSDASIQETVDILGVVGSYYTFLGADMFFPLQDVRLLPFLRSKNNRLIPDPGFHT